MLTDLQSPSPARRARLVRRAATALLGVLLAVAGLLTAALPAAADPTPPVGGAFHAVTPARILDTRSGLGVPHRAGPLGTISLPVLGRGGIPASGVSAIALHLTVPPSTVGYLTVWPAGTSRPVVSTLNYIRGHIVTNTVLVSVGVGGAVDLYNGSGLPTQMIADVTGYVDQTGGDGRGAYATLDPARILDTRSGLGAPTAAPLAPGATLHLAVLGHGGVPTVSGGFGVAAAALNVAAVNPGATGYLTVWADGTPRPVTSNLNFSRGETIANLTVPGIGSGGGVDIYNGSSRPLNVIADVSGYFSGGSPNSSNQFGSLTPRRVLDTRNGTGAPARAVGPGATLTLSLGTAPRYSAVLLNLTVTEPSGFGYLTAWPDGAARPTTSSLNFLYGQTLAAFNVVPVGADGKIDIYNSSNRTVEIIADESGYITA